MSTLQAVHEVGSAVSIRDGEVELLRYTYEPDTPRLESPRPFAFPIRTRHGDDVALFRPHDHVWHKGLSWALPVVDDENFWGGPTYVHGRFYVQLENNGTQGHVGKADVDVDDEGVRIAHDLSWTTQSGECWFLERRTLTARILSDDAWMLTWDTAMTNTRGADISIGSPTTRGRENAGYGGLFWRGPRSFTDGTLVTPNGTGSGSEVRGEPHPWMGFAGRHDITDAESVVVMVDDAQNPCHPPQWFARSEEFAALNPAPFFSEELLVPAEETVRFRYGVAFASGGAGDAGALAEKITRALRPTEVPT
ncbi:PmoA family protein [Microbacterium sp. G2-8]|uniref:DUF6807 domain-containing protein n=1 Tax=Microbacterium sp. G2-8 TaxID=2842454 RepID=UPI001C8A8077|nr:PmoA family protein [Microbacterium sp. G2-8]